MRFTVSSPFAIPVTRSVLFLLEPGDDRGVRYAMLTWQERRDSSDVRGLGLISVPHERRIRVALGSTVNGYLSYEGMLRVDRMRRL